MVGDLVRISTKPTLVGRRIQTRINVILNTFHTRHPDILSVLWNSLCIPILLFNTNAMGQLSASEEQVLERVQRKYTKHMFFNGNILNYPERLDRAKMLSVQRRREQIALINIGNVIRDHKLTNIGLEVERFNSRTRIRLKRIIVHHNIQKLKTTEEKMFGPWAMSLFNCLPSQIKLSVENKPYYNQKVKLLCKSLDDSPWMGTFEENSVIARIQFGH